MISRIVNGEIEEESSPYARTILMMVTMLMSHLYVSSVGIGTSLISAGFGALSGL